MYLKTEGVILSRKNFGEADKILTVYTKDFGKVTCIAKGVRRPKSKKGGHIEIGNWCKVFLAKGKNIDLLTEVELKEAFGIDKFNVKKSNRIYHLLEIVESLTGREQKNQNIFRLLIEFLREIKEDEDFNLISSVFKIKLLSELGFFSAKSLSHLKSQKFLEKLEDEDFATLKESVRLKKDSYLKLLLFLDSMIENLIEKRLKTTRFLSGT